MINDDIAPVVFATRSHDVSFIDISKMPNFSSENSKSSFTTPNVEVKTKI